MPPLLSPHRARAEISLQATEPQDEPTTPLDLHPDAPPVAWPLAAAVAGIVAALAGWILTAGLAVVGWLAAPPTVAAGSLADALGFATTWWLLSHGAGALIAGLPVTLVPWAATGVFAVVLARCTLSAVGWSARRRSEETTTGPGRRVAAAAALAWLGYAAPVCLVAVLHGGTTLQPALLATALLLGASTAWASMRAIGHRPTRRWPGWAQPLPRAVLAGIAILTTGGAAAVVTALWRHVDRVVQLTEAVDAGVVGSLVLWLAQLAYAPTAIVWGAAYALGAGFSLGAGSLVSPAITELGVVPGLPILAALPAEGPGPTALLAWLAVGVLGGAVPAWIVARARPGARLDETCLVGGLSGVAVALVFVVLAWATRGDLGADRLTGLGPRLLPLLVLAGSTLGLAGMGTGLVMGLVRWWRAREGSVPTPFSPAALVRLPIRPRPQAGAATEPGGVPGPDAQVDAPEREDAGVVADPDTRDLEASAPSAPVEVLPAAAARGPERDQEPDGAGPEDPTAVIPRAQPAGVSDEAAGSR